MSTRTIRHYSDAVKQHVVSEIEAGRLSVAEARRRFGITGSQTIYNWLARMGKSTRTATRLYVQMKDEQDPLTLQQQEIQRLRSEKQALESALAQKEIKLLYLESLLEAAERRYGPDFKKNSGQKPSPSPECT